MKRRLKFKIVYIMTERLPTIRTDFAFQTTPIIFPNVAKDKEHKIVFQMKNATGEFALIANKMLSN